MKGFSVGPVLVPYPVLKGMLNCFYNNVLVMHVFQSRVTFMRVFHSTSHYYMIFFLNLTDKILSLVFFLLVCVITSMAPAVCSTHTRFLLACGSALFMKYYLQILNSSVTSKIVGGFHAALFGPIFSSFISFE